MGGPGPAWPTLGSATDISPTDIPKDKWFCPDCSDDLEFIGVKKMDISVIPSLPNNSWMQRATSKINEYSKIEEVHVTKDPSFNIQSCIEINPYKCIKIKGDGNCLFRAVSAFITGREDDHFAVRLAVTNFMKASQNTNNFSSSLAPNSTMCNYILNKGMHKLGTWGTDVEINVVATMLQVTVNVFTSYGKSGRQWTRYNPIFTNDLCLEKSTTSISLYHSKACDHFDLAVNDK